MQGICFMMKAFFFISLLSVGSLHAQTFEGCGTYVFKGILKEDLNSKNRISYYVHEGTKSQMIFEIPNDQDLLDLVIMLNVSSTFTGKITKLMDGTKGVVTAPTKISRRFPDPLNSASTGIIKISDEKCD
jgi:hypothetical protein